MLLLRALFVARRLSHVPVHQAQQQGRADDTLAASNLMDEPATAALPTLLLATPGLEHPREESVVSMALALARQLTVWVQESSEWKVR